MDIYIYIQNYALENNISPAAKLFDMSERAITKHLKLVCDYLGYSGIGSHSFRKYFATCIYVNNHYDINIERIETLKASKYKKEHTEDNRVSKKSMDLTNNEIFGLGMEAGRKQLADHILHQFEIGKPCEINGELYWLKDAKQNLIDIMDDIESAWNEESGVHKFIVPIMLIYNDKEVKREVIIETVDAETAMLIAIGDF